ncbi:hypothetical protein J6590_080182 [Homalodisca vitripennis]|nr:hypothetical protein J6590_080182 [Homalodisca vitripennis]
MLGAQSWAMEIPITLGVMVLYLNDLVSLRMAELTNTMKEVKDADLSLQTPLFEKKN